MCNGQGKYYHAFLKNYQICPSCLGSKMCKTCGGKGNSFIVKLWGPGEAEAYMQAKREMSGSSSSSTTTVSSSSKSASTCPDCGGKGYRQQAYTYAAGSNIAPYHNATGTSCFVCGQSTDHYHYRCTTCKQH